MHCHELQGRLPNLEPLSGLHGEVCQALAVEPGTVGTPRIADADLAALEDDFGVPTRRLRVVENDVARLSTNGGGRSADVACLGRTIDVLDLENVVATHSFLRGSGRESRNAERPTQGRTSQARAWKLRNRRRRTLGRVAADRPIARTPPEAHYPQPSITPPLQACLEPHRASPARSRPPRQGALEATAGQKRVPAPSAHHRS